MAEREILGRLDGVLESASRWDGSGDWDESAVVAHWENWLSDIHSGSGCGRRVERLARSGRVMSGARVSGDLRLTPGDRRREDYVGLLSGMADWMLWSKSPSADCAGPGRWSSGCSSSSSGGHPTASDCGRRLRITSQWSVRRRKPAPRRASLRGVYDA